MLKLSDGRFSTWPALFFFPGAVRTRQSDREETPFSYLPPGFFLFFLTVKPMKVVIVNEERFSPFQ